MQNFDLMIKTEVFDRSYTCILSKFGKRHLGFEHFYSYTTSFFMVLLRNIWAFSWKWNRLQPSKWRLFISSSVTSLKVIYCSTTAITFC